MAGKKIIKKSAPKKKTTELANRNSRHEALKPGKKSDPVRRLIVRKTDKKKVDEKPEEFIPIPIVKLPAAKKKEFRDMLLGLRERITRQIVSLKGDSLQRFDAANSEEDGTDAFDRQFALNLVSSEQDALFEIDEALRRLEEGIYGVCLQCRKLVEPPRLKALPFVKLCVSCQSQNEKGRYQGYRSDENVAYHAEAPDQDEPADNADSV